MVKRRDVAFVNFQDREGSTAMHLAASCGYLECVKTLLSFGADITLRNAIGQTPLEEAELSDLRGSSECVAHLRVIWRQLEEEASARMIAMLEMEESASVGTEGARAGSKKSKKKQKHKNSKRKAATATKAQKVANDGETSTADGTPIEVDGPVVAAHSDAQVTSADGPDRGDDETSTEVQPSNDVNSDEDGDSDADVDGGGNGTSKLHSDDETIRASDNSHDHPTPDRTPGVEATQGVWTTVGRKHRGGSVLAGGSVESKAAASTRSSSQSHHRSPPKKGADTRALHSSPKRVAPTDTTARSVAATTHPTVATTELPRRDAPARAPRSQAATKASAAPSVPATATSSGFTPRPAPAAPGSSGYAQGLLGASSMWRTTGQPGAFSGAFRLQPPPHLLSSSLLSAPTSSLYAPAAVNGIPAASRFAWKHGHFHHHYPSHYYYYHHHQQSCSRVGTQGFVRETTTRWIGKLQLGNAAVSDSLALLACGHCGELVDDNLQCSGDLSSTVSAAGNDSSTRSVCTQLYCSSCITRVAAGSEHFTCVKCRRSVARALMRRNEFAQQQAASLALSINHSGTTADAGPSANSSSQVMSLDGMQHALFATVPRAEAVDLRVSDLIPGASNLSTLSNGQLEVLDAAHAAARQSIVDQQIVNARALERVQLLEWLKLHRVALPSQSLTPVLFSTSSSPLASSMALGTPTADVMSSTPSSMQTTDLWQA